MGPPTERHAASPPPREPDGGGAQAKAWKRRALRVVVSLGLLGLLVVWVDIAAVGRRLADVRLPGLAVVLALITADRFLMAYKWWLLLRGRRLPVGFWQAVRAYYVASFAGLVLPVTLGADIVRVIAVPRTVPASELAASIVVERSIGAMAQAMIGAMALVLLTREAGVAVGGVWWLVGAALLVGGTLLVVVSFPLATMGNRWRHQPGLRGKLAALLQAYAAYGSLKALLVVFFVLTALEGFFPVAIHFAVARTLDLALPFSLFLATVPIVLLVARLPISLGGIGVVELSFVYLASRLGVASADALAVALMAEAALLLSLLPGAVVYRPPALRSAPGPESPRASESSGRARG